MQLDEFVQTIYDAGGLLWLEGDKVHARLPERLRPLVSVIRERKPELVELLVQRLAMPAGVRLLSYAPVTPPIRLSEWETVIDTDKFIESTLQQLDARLHGNQWLAGNWPLSGLLDRLAAVGCILALDDPKAALQ